VVNQYSVDFKLKIVKMILNEHISKHEIERTHHVCRKTQRDWVRNCPIAVYFTTLLIS
jgi:transposase